MVGDNGLNTFVSTNVGFEAATTGRGGGGIRGGGGVGVTSKGVAISTAAVSEDSLSTGLERESGGAVIWGRGGGKRGGVGATIVGVMTGGVSCSGKIDCDGSDGGGGGGGIEIAFGRGGGGIRGGVGRRAGGLLLFTEIIVSVTGSLGRRVG